MSDNANKMPSANAEGTKTPEIDVGKVAKQQDNIISHLSSLEKKLEQLAVNSQPVRQEPIDSEKLEDLVFADPAKFASKIAEKVRSDVSAEKAKSDSESFEFSNTFSNLSEEYPELLKPSSDLYTKARELLVKYSNGKPNDAAALERAVFRASNELGIPALKYRKNEDNMSSDYNDDDSFSGSSSSGQTSGNKKSRNKEGDLDPRTVEFARMLGRPVNDPAYIKKLKEIEKNRKGNWGKYK